MTGLEVTIDTQPDLRGLGRNPRNSNTLNHLILHVGDGLLTIREAYLLLAHLEIDSLATLLQGKYTRVAIES